MNLQWEWSEQTHRHQTQGQYVAWFCFQYEFSDPCLHFPISYLIFHFFTLKNKINMGNFEEAWILLSTLTYYDAWQKKQPLLV